jgi:hypothetical protein
MIAAKEDHRYDVIANTELILPNSEVSPSDEPDALQAGALRAEV